MRFADRGARRIALALDGAVAARSLLGHQVDAGVRAVEAWRPRRPIRPPPHVGEPVLVHRIFGEELAHQTLEESALLMLGLGYGTELFEGLVETRHR